MLKICLGTIVSLCLSVAWAQDPSLVCAEGGCIQPGITTQATSQAAFSREAASDITVVDAAAIGGNSLSFFKNYFVTGDYAVAGVGLRGRGVGGFATANINMAGVPANADIMAAFLYWETLGNGANGTFRGAALAGTALGTTASPCWPQASITVYRADVLKFFAVDANGRAIVNGAHTVSLPDSGNQSSGNSTEGASLVVVYRVAGAGLPYKAVVLYDGAFTMPATSNTFNLTLQGFYQASSVNPQARMTHIVGDGQTFADNLTINGTTFNNVFNGAQGEFWDNLTQNVTLAGNASQVTTSSTLVNDCLTWGAVVFSTTVQDTDGDGLLDTWESSGFTDMDGSFVNLPAMGANPNVKDIFIEIDWMVAGTHSHKPKQAALDKIIAAFQAAPGGPIVMHIDTGQGGAFTGGNAIPEQVNTTWKQAGYLPLKAANFAANRRFLYHHSVWGHALQAALGGTSGIADLPGGDFMVTLGLWRHFGPAPTFTPTADDMVGTVDEQAGTFMHELGHNLNLKHGGGDHLPNCKPNVQSVMNYAYQVTGLQNAAGQIKYDYSRQVLPNLDEANLNEGTGLGATTYRARYFAPANIIDQILGRASTRNCFGQLGNQQMVRKDGPTTLNGPINWNNDFFGFISAGVQADLNYNALNQVLDAYPGFADWPAVDLQQVGGRSNGSASSGDTANDLGDTANLDSLDVTFENASATPPPSPTHLSARVAPGSVALAWNPVLLTIVRRYNVWRYTTDPNLAQQIGHTEGTRPPPTFTDNGPLAPGVQYTYFVTDVDEYNNQSDISNLVTVTAQ